MQVRLLPASCTPRLVLHAPTFGYQPTHWKQANAIECLFGSTCTANGIIRLFVGLPKIVRASFSLLALPQSALNDINPSIPLHVSRASPSQRSSRRSLGPARRPLYSSGSVAHPVCALLGPGLGDRAATEHLPLYPDQPLESRAGWKQ